MRVKTHTAPGGDTTVRVVNKDNETLSYEVVKKGLPVEPAKARARGVIAEIKARAKK